jgi:hypothetical protein
MPSHDGGIRLALEVNFYTSRSTSYKTCTCVVTAVLALRKRPPNVHSRCGPNAAVATSDAANRFSRSASGKLLGGHASCHSELSPFAFRPSVPLLRRAGIRRAPATPLSGASVPGAGALTMQLAASAGPRGEGGERWDPGRRSRG